MEATRAEKGEQRCAIRDGRTRSERASAVMSFVRQFLAQYFLPNNFAGGAVERHYRELKGRRGRTATAETTAPSATLPGGTTRSTAGTPPLLTISAAGKRLLLQPRELRREV